ncbi:MULTISPECIES: DUF2484 family protein [unclassified Sulfitobacter]|uniref:DUF2484 family protein n=1 Tax=unclassified Sulfitobacter TaxID=196795 RepID=UPI0007C3030F|nr:MULTISPECIES: DUF2484 family protein [unclassified Sulfitobacter]KZX98930.1 hypothetical protein A3721_05875 [Sulfitobacter sp. HI0023]KZY24885.1 hypothetical protein A3728_04215 [Sulfitobacter sp. HI0040]KZZ64386.1 hypothetical protein A3764_04630 [Sulfitobacter sp. HI0129]
MSTSLILACFWAVIANVVAMTPSSDNHWRSAYGLVAVGIPLVGYVTAQHGPLAGVLVLAAGCSILRWPVVHLGRYLGRSLRRGRLE